MRRPRLASSAIHRRGADEMNDIQELLLHEMANCADQYSCIKNIYLWRAETIGPIVELE
jgi:hypothetical protein